MRCDVCGARMSMNHGLTMYFECSNPKCEFVHSIPERHIRAVKRGVALAALFAVACLAVGVWYVLG